MAFDFEAALTARNQLLSRAAALQVIAEERRRQAALLEGDQSHQLKALNAQAEQLDCDRAIAEQLARGQQEQIAEAHYTEMPNARDTLEEYARRRSSGLATDRTSRERSR